MLILVAVELQTISKKLRMDVRKYKKKILIGIGAMIALLLIVLSESIYVIVISPEVQASFLSDIRGLFN